MHPGTSLVDAIRMQPWATMRSEDGESSGWREGRPMNAQSLNAQIASGVARAWPTMTTQDAENDAGPSQFQRNTLPLNAAVQASSNVQRPWSA
jgi:hypothetical protein